VPRLETAGLSHLGARRHRFAGSGVALPEPDGDRLSARLVEFGPPPTASLVGTSDLDAATDAVSLTAPERWQDDRVTGFDHPALRDWLCVVEDAH